LAALDSPEDRPQTPAWQPSVLRRITVLALTLLAVGLAIALVATGPAGPLTYEMRLPLLVLAGGALANAVQWRRRVDITPDEVIVRTLLRTRGISVLSVTRVETDGCRVVIRTRTGRKAIVRAVTGSSAADNLANAIVIAAGPGACLAEAPPAPVPLATPWLIMLSAAGAGFLTAAGYTVDPALVITALIAGAAVGCAALCSSLLWEHRGERVSEPGS
jgi:hypothetical protein